MMKRIMRTVCLILAFLVMLSVFNAETDVMAETSDYSEVTWMEAFDRLHDRFSTEYAFTEWKGIAWDTVGLACREAIQDAEDNVDFEAYYLALRRYVNAIPDGHVGMTFLPEIDEKHISGGFGFTPVMLDDGTVIAVWVDKASEAYRAGLRPGDELLTWDGVPLTEAAASKPAIFASNAATSEDSALKRMAFLVREAVGKDCELTFRAETGETHSAVLTAYDDDMSTISKTYPVSVVSDRLREVMLGIEGDSQPLSGIIEYEIFDGNIAYIRVWGEFDADLTGSGRVPSTIVLFQQAIQEAVEAECRGLILDIRNNAGGLDAMTAEMLGSFYREETFYEYQNDYDYVTGTRKIVQAMPDSRALMIRPADTIFTGRIIALINQKCVSSGEGLALGIRNLPNGETLGFFGTNGSFGLTGSEALMPGDLTVVWPAGQSLDANQLIQLDSRYGAGGVEPTIRIPMTREHALLAAQGDDVELASALSILRDD